MGAWPCNFVQRARDGKKGGKSYSSKLCTRRVQSVRPNLDFLMDKTLDQPDEPSGHTACCTAIELVVSEGLLRVAPAGWLAPVLRFDVMTLCASRPRIKLLCYTSRLSCWSSAGSGIVAARTNPIS